MKLNKEQIKIFKMKKTVILLGTTVALNFSTQAQLLRGIGNMVKAKAAEKLTSEVDKRVTNVFNGKKSAGGSIDTKVDQASQSENAPALVKVIPNMTSSRVKASHIMKILTGLLLENYHWAGIRM